MLAPCLSAVMTVVSKGAGSMRAVWSFWSKPFSAFKGRIWREPQHHLLAWGLSLSLARRHYPETALVTDEAGAELLIERLGLSFTHVSTELEQLSQVDVGWWAMGKLLTYSLQDQPFVHLDTDVFLWRPLPARLAAAPVFAQSPEHHALDEWCGPRDIEQAFRKHGVALPKEWEWARSQGGSGFREENCGILGGTRVDFIRYYARLALELALAPAHAAAWAELSDKSGYNMMLEQFLLAACVQYHRCDPTSTFRGIGIKHLFPSFAEAFNPQTAARAGFTHLMGDIKSNDSVVRRLEQCMQSEDRAFYQQCLRVARMPPPVARVGVR
jgi:hypothetical protein